MSALEISVCGYYQSEDESYCACIEDAPAPAGIHSFEAHVSDGKIYVTANPDHTTPENKSRPPKLSTTGFDAVGKGTIIIGGGAGAFGVMESLRNVRVLKY